MKQRPPKDLGRLAEELGITPKQLQGLAKEYEDGLVPKLQVWWLESRDEVRLMGKTGGETSIYAASIRTLQRHADNDADPEGERPPKPVEARYVAQARAQDAQRGAALIAACLDVQAAIRERMDRDEFRELTGLTVRRLNRDIDKLIKREKRRAA